LAGIRVSAGSDDAIRRARARAFVVTMGLVAMLGDVTYEGARAVSGAYLEILGASALAIGFAAGLGELFGYGLRVATGWLADRTRAHWAFVIGGYTITIVAVPALALAGRWEVALALLLLERIGKAVRSPARSTLVSHAANEAGAGKSFGIEEALDQIGAVAGPLLVAAVLWTRADAPPVDRFRTAFAVLLVPGLALLALVLRARRRNPRPEELESAAPPGRVSGMAFAAYVAASALLGFGFADWALVAYHALHIHLVAPEAVPLVYAGAMAVDALAALGLGALFDRIGLRALALAAVVSAAFAPLAFFAPSVWVLALGAIVWGIGMGAQESISKAAIARIVRKEERGRAYGVFYAVFGLAWWIGSATMGWLYDVSLAGLVAVSVGAQLAAAAAFLALSRGRNSSRLREPPAS
jgi:MFS family permease